MQVESRHFVEPRHASSLFDSFNINMKNKQIPFDDEFESSVILACELVLKEDPRIGKIPKSNKKVIMSKKN